ncbi:NAD(P)H-binding protein [Peribacillus butanolivorans]|uniref:NAD(P)H-binding protein n=1 Tax=Peribacillus butanolivorans TaxID=421767 RepID=UPI0036DB12B0
MFLIIHNKLFEEIRLYLEARQDVYVHLKASGMTYTIVRPVALTNYKVVGKITAEEKVDPPHKSIPRTDVTTVLAHPFTEEKPPFTKNI